MKAADLAVDSKVYIRRSPHVEGIVIANKLRQGDEIIAIELDYSLVVQTINVNEVMKLSDPGE